MRSRAKKRHLLKQCGKDDLNHLIKIQDAKAARGGGGTNPILERSQEDLFLEKQLSQF